MWRWIKTFLVIGVILLLLGGGYLGLKTWLFPNRPPEWRTEEVAQGDLSFVVNSTGTIRPVMSVQVGSFVSGPIDPNTPLVEYNQEVKKGDILAIIDQRIYEADVARDCASVEAAEASLQAAQASVEAAHASVESAKASLKTRQAEVQRATALLKQAENDEYRAQDLARENPDFISQSEMDQILYQRKQLEAQLSVAEAGVDQAEAALMQSKAAVTEVTASQARAKATVSQAKANMLRSELNRDYTVIKSPVDGIVIDRKIEPGQTLTAQFQTPELYTIAPNMREEIHVYASVDEADIGLIREAKAKDAKVEFTVDAYPEDLFEGSIKEVRFSSTMTQNVVTYPVIVSAANPELKLLPGMTASISFSIDKKENILKVPNTALRFYPEKKYVHPDDHEILDGAGRSEKEEEELATGEPPVAEKADAASEQHRRHVWVADGEKLRAIEVVTGIRDHEYTQLVSGELEKGKKLVIGVKD